MYDLLRYDAKCAAKGSAHKAVGVHNGKVCCGEVPEETTTQRIRRVLILAVKIVQSTTTKRQREEVLGKVREARELEDTRFSGSTARSVLHSLYAYTNSLLSFGVRRPVTLMLFVTATVLVSYGLTSEIIANLTNRVGTWEVGKSMAGLSGQAAAHATRTELTRAQTQQYTMLIDAATPVVRGALGLAIGGAAAGALPASAGIMAAAAAAGALTDAQTAANTASAAADATSSTLSAVGSAFLSFVLYSASIE